MQEQRNQSSPEQFRAMTKEEIIAWYSGTEFTNYPVVQPHEQEFVENKLEVARACGWDEEETQSYIDSELRLRRRDQRLVAPILPAAETGSKVKAGASKGASITNKGRAEIYAEDAKTYQAEVDALVDSGNGVSYAEACRQVGKSHKVHPDTVGKKTTNNFPRNGSRHRPK